MNELMYDITVAEHPDFLIPYFGFRGTPVGIDVFKVTRAGDYPGDRWRAGWQERRTDRRRDPAGPAGMLYRRRAGFRGFPLALIRVSFPVRRALTGQAVGVVRFR